MQKKENIIPIAETVYTTYLDLHQQLWIKLKMMQKTTKQLDNDYMKFCVKLEEVYREQGFEFFHKIDEALPENSWLVLFRKHTAIISLEDISKREPLQ